MPYGRVAEVGYDFMRSRALERVPPWRIRLVAYGARLESVLGESPRGFESPILRQIEPAPRRAEW